MAKYPVVKYVGGVERTLHNPESPVYSKEAAIVELHRLWELFYSVYWKEVHPGKYIIYRSLFPNTQKRGRLPKDIITRIRYINGHKRVLYRPEAPFFNDELTARHANVLFQKKYSVHTIKYSKNGKNLIYISQEPNPKIGSINGKKTPILGPGRTDLYQKMV